MIKSEIAYALRYCNVLTHFVSRSMTEPHRAEMSIRHKNKKAKTNAIAQMITRRMDIDVTIEIILLMPVQKARR